MPELVVLEHTDGAGVAGFAPVLDGRVSIAPWRALDVPGGAALPEHVEDLAGLVVMGGTMSATDPRAHPWMAPELELLRAAHAAQVPVLGVCLGAQLLASALGGEVTARDVPEVGYVPLVRTSAGRDDRVLGGWPDGAAALFVHEDEVTALPPGAEPLLTGSDGTPAWRVGSAWAVQFHPEVDAAQLRTWVEHADLAPLLARAGVDGGQLAAEGARRDRVVSAHGRGLVGRFLDAVVRPRVA